MSKLKNTLQELKIQKSKDSDYIILNLNKKFLLFTGGVGPTAGWNKSCSNARCHGNDGLASNDNNKSCLNDTCNDTAHMNNDGCTNRVCS